MKRGPPSSGFMCAGTSSTGWMLACSLAGVSGVLFTIMKCSVSPSMMDAGAGGSILMMTLLGGLGTLWGPFMGAGVFIFAQDYISTMTEHWMIFLGLLIDRARPLHPQRDRRVFGKLSFAKNRNRVHMAILEIKNLHRHFGGVAAIQGVNLTFAENELRSIIGPNGAGKTTLFNVITGRMSGELRAR